MQKPPDDRPAIPNISSDVNFMWNILSMTQVYQFVGRAICSTISNSVRFTLSRLPDHVKARALTFGCDGFLRKPFRDGFRFTSCKVPNRCEFIEFGCDDVGQFATELLCIRGRRREKCQSPKIVLENRNIHLSPARYGKRTVRPCGRCVLILVTIRRWSETSLHSFTQHLDSTWLLRPGHSFRELVLEHVKSDLITRARFPAHQCYCPRDCRDG